jgi:hypothetical protein
MHSAKKNENNIFEPRIAQQEMLFRIQKISSENCPRKYAEP